MQSSEQKADSSFDYVWKNIFMFFVYFYLGKFSETHLFFILFKLFWKLLLLLERASFSDFSSSSSIICRELLRTIAGWVGCGFGLNDHRFVAKSNPPRVNDVSNTESFSDPELSEIDLAGLRSGVWLLGFEFLFVEDLGSVGTFSTFLTGERPRSFLAVLGTGFETSFDFDLDRGVFCLRVRHGSVMTLTGLKFRVSVDFFAFTFFSFGCLVLITIYDS